MANSLLKKVSLSIQMDKYFQHAGAPAHSTYHVKKFLNKHFAGKWIGH